MRQRTPASVRRIGWGLLDQIVSSGTNFIIGILLARSASLADFGAFSLAFFVYTTAISICRAFPMEPLAIRYSGVDAADWRRGAAAATGTALAAGTITGLIAIAVGLAFGGVLGACLLAFGLTMPGLVLQDSWRYAFFAAARGRDAFLNDVVWAALLGLGVLLLLLTGSLSVVAGGLVFGLTASGAAIFGLLQAGFWPRPDRARAWWHEQHDLAGRFLAEVTVRNVVYQLTAYGIGLVAGLAAVGTIRAGQLLLAPIQVVFYGISLVAVPEAVRALHRSRQDLLRLGLVASAGLVALALSWGTVMLLLPESVGELLLGPNWTAARAILPPLLVSLTATVAVIGAGMGLRALAAARLILRAGLLAAGVGLVVPLTGAALGGVTGAAIGLACSAIASTTIWWAHYRLAWRAPVAGAPTLQPAADLATPGLD
jgi:O-antigen/teichoic acid export membrane protein